VLNRGTDIAPALGFMSAMLQDFRYAFRQAVRQPGLSIVIVITLAVGVGAATTAFSLLNTLALRQPPYPDVDRLAALHSTAARGDQGRGPLAATALAELPGTGMFDALVGYTPRGFNCRGGGFRRPDKWRGDLRGSAGPARRPARDGSNLHL